MSLNCFLPNSTKRYLVYKDGKKQQLIDCRADKWKTECQYCKNEYPLPFYLVFRSIFLSLLLFWKSTKFKKSWIKKLFFATFSGRRYCRKKTVLDPSTWTLIIYPFNTKIFSLSWTKLNENKLSTSWVHTHKWEQCYQTV